MESILKFSALLEESISSATKEVKAREQEIAEREKKFEESKKEMEKRFPIKEGVITLNVGGRIFTTYKSTLCKVEGSMLEAMFSGRHDLARDEQGRYFVDRDGDSFSFILNYLRTDQLIWPDSNHLREQLRLELEYFGLEQNGVASSSILTDSHMQQLNTWVKEELSKSQRTSRDPNLVLVYRGSQDGFMKAKSHTRSDTTESNIFVIQSTDGMIFGRFTLGNIQGNYVTVCYFSLVNKQGGPIKINNMQEDIHNYSSTPIQLADSCTNKRNLIIDNNLVYSGIYHNAKFYVKEFEAFKIK